MSKPSEGGHAQAASLISTPHRTMSPTKPRRASSRLSPTSPRSEDSEARHQEILPQLHCGV